MVSVISEEKKLVISCLPVNGATIATVVSALVILPLAFALASELRRK